jgi:hypothetical protein
LKKIKWEKERERKKREREEGKAWKGKEMSAAQLK